MVHGAGTLLHFRHDYNPIFRKLVKLHTKDSFKIRNGQIIVLYQELFVPTNKPGFRCMYLYHQDSSHKTTAAVNICLIPRIPQHITEILRTEATKSIQQTLRYTKLAILLKSTSAML